MGDRKNKPKDSAGAMGIYPMPELSRKAGSPGRAGREGGCAKPDAPIPPSGTGARQRTPKAFGAAPAKRDRGVPPGGKNSRTSSATVALLNDFGKRFLGAPAGVFALFDSRRIRVKPVVPACGTSPMRNAK